MTGAPVPGPGAPVVASAISSTAAMPIAVPSWAAVLMTPDAAPRSTSGTVVPRVVAATEDRPSPALLWPRWLTGPRGAGRLGPPRRLPRRSGQPGGQRRLGTDPAERGRGRGRAGRPARLAAASVAAAWSGLGSGCFAGTGWPGSWRSWWPRCRRSRAAARRSGGIRSAAAGSNGAAARRSALMNKAVSGTANREMPRRRPAGRAGRSRWRRPRPHDGRWTRRPRVYSGPGVARAAVTGNSARDGGRERAGQRQIGPEDQAPAGQVRDHPADAKPLAPADAPAALHAAIARRRGGPAGVRVVSSRSAEGTDAAAAAPCRRRPR